MPQYAIIKVKAKTDAVHDLDWYVEGIYGVELSVDVQPRRPLEEHQSPEVEAALDQFHDSVAIKVLDDFDITVEIKQELKDCPEETLWL
jgi:hypothetical protein